MTSPHATAAVECALDGCEHAPVTVLTYATSPAHTYPLCATHRAEAITWVHTRWGEDVEITETAPATAGQVGQPALFDPAQARQTR